jgi:hypothetical protein
MQTLLGRVGWGKKALETIGEFP